MEGFFIACVGAGVLILVVRIMASRVPKASSGEIDRFKDTLPQGYGYPYFLDGTGHAVNVKENKLLLFSGGRQHVYGLDEIRGFRYGMNGADQVYLTGKHGVSSHINAGLKNRSLKKEAFNNSGIFVEVADIDTPVIQIKYSSEADMRRSVEILQQFMDGTLMDYEEYLRRRA